MRREPVARLHHLARGLGIKRLVRIADGRAGTTTASQDGLWPAAAAAAVQFVDGTAERGGGEAGELDDDGADSAGVWPDCGGGDDDDDDDGTVGEALEAAPAPPPAVPAVALEGGLVAASAPAPKPASPPDRADESALDRHSSPSWNKHPPIPDSSLNSLKAATPQAITHLLS